MGTNYYLISKGMFRNFQSFLTHIMIETEVEAICDIAEQYLNELHSTADFRNNKVIKKHMLSYILPAISCYRALQIKGFSKDVAKELVAEYMNEQTEKIARKLRYIGKMPSFYRLFIFVFKKVMASSYPKEGWNIKWIALEKNRVMFEMHSCLYCDVLDQYQSRELTPLFCHLDVISYKNMSEQVLFRRTKTLATACDCCDFSFYKVEK